MASEFLNSLSADTIIRLFDYMQLKGRMEHVYNPIVNDVPERLPAMYPINPSEVRGLQWDMHITCQELNREGATMIDFSQRYPRMQVTFSKGAVKRTASGLAVTPASQSAAYLRDKIFDGRGGREWESFKALAGAGVKTGIMCHHIAYARRRVDEPTLPQLPPELGSGQDVAHLCDNHMCTKPSHMYVMPHLENMSMQRCRGATLAVIDGVIVQVVQCPHYKKNAAGIVTQPSCANLQIIDLSGGVQVVQDKMAAFDDARAKYEADVMEI